MKTKLTAIILALVLSIPIIISSLTPPTWQSELQFKPLDIPLEVGIQEFAYYLSHTYDIDFCLVVAIIQTESACQPNIISRTGSYGLMQIHKVNHGWLADNLGLTDFLNPYQNIRAGVYILNDLFDKYGDINKVLMAYNLGEHGAIALWQGGVYRTGYVNKILNTWEELKNG